MAAFIIQPLANCRAVDAVAGDTPLHVAARDRNMYAYNINLVYAADPSAAGVRNARGQLPIHVMIEHRREALFWEMLAAETWRDHLLYVPWERDEDVLSPDAGRNPLVTAIEQGNFYAAKYMVTCEWPIGRRYVETPSQPICVRLQRVMRETQSRVCTGVSTPGVMQRRGNRSAGQQERRLSPFQVPDQQETSTTQEQQPALCPFRIPLTQHHHGLCPRHRCESEIAAALQVTGATQPPELFLTDAHTFPHFGVPAVRQPVLALLEEQGPGIVKDFLTVMFRPREAEDGCTMLEEREGKVNAFFAACRIGYWGHVRCMRFVDELCPPRLNDQGQSALHNALIHLPKDRVGTEEIRLLLSPPAHVQGKTCPVWESQLILLHQLGYNLQTVLNLFERLRRAPRPGQTSSMDTEYQLFHRVLQSYWSNPLTLKQLAVNATRQGLPCVRPEAIEGLRLPAVIKNQLMLTGL